MTEAIALGIPTMHAQTPVLATRRPTRKIRVGSLNVSGDAPITVQSMTTAETHDIGVTLQQITELTAAGYDIVHVACLTGRDTEALLVIARQSRIPVIADIHLNPKYTFAAIEAGCGAIRVNPGNIRKFDDQVAGIYKAASNAGVSLHIGISTGSLDKCLFKKYGKATPEALVELATREAKFFEENDLHDLKVSAKHHDVVITMQAYRPLSEAGRWPLHLDVTEAGSAFQGAIKSCAAFSTLSAEGAGDTIRVSLSAPPVEEVKVGTKLLEFMGLCERQLGIIPCPSCGRAQVDVWTLAEEVEVGLKEVTVPLCVAVVGCVVSGPGEVREADLGCASGSDKDQISVHDQVAETVPEGQVVEALLKYAEAMTAEITEELEEETLIDTSPMVSAVG